MPLEELAVFLIKLNYPNMIKTSYSKKKYGRVDYMVKSGIGLSYPQQIDLHTSGGEFQRIKLATALEALVGSMYIMDESSMGLQPRDITV